MYKDKFVLSIIHNGQPIKESGGKGSKQVAIPFGSEYKIRLKNKNDRGCTARITIDGSPVSNLGDIIVGAGDTVDLERFITDSMTKGKRFKFVELDHPDVDDPTRSENGIVRVEFRLAKKKDIKIDWDWRDYRPPYQSKRKEPFGPYFENNDGTHWFIGHTTYSSGDVGGNNYNNSTLKCSNTYDSSSVMYCASNVLSNNISCTEAGATIEGGNSNQSFTYSSLDVESSKTVLQLKIVGINNRYKITQSYCTKCGHKIEDRDRYCGGCGRRL